jgi:hypothetical protein
VPDIAVTQVGLQRSRIVASHTLVMLLDISLQIGRRHETRTNSDRADELMAQYAEHGFHYWVAQTLVGSRAYFIIRSQLSAGKPQVREFAEWLVAEAGDNAKEESG